MMRCATYALLPLLLALIFGVAFSSCERGTAPDAETAAGLEAEAPPPVNWKLASTFPATMPTLGQGPVGMTERLRTVTRGRIDIKFFDPGKLVPALEVFDSVSQGAIDAGYSASGYWVGKIPAATIFTTVPFGPSPTEFLAWIYNGGGWELWQEIYRPSNIFPIPCGIQAPDGAGWFRAPVETMEDFAGLKIRYFGLAGEALQKVGASVQLLASGDLYPALERGVLDGLEFSTPVVDETLGFSRIAKHYYFPGWHSPHAIQELIVNLDRWNELQRADQLLIEMACRDTMLRMVAEAEQAQVESLETYKQQGVELHYWSDEVLRGLKAAYEEVIAENVSKDEDFARVWASLSAFRERFAEWARLSRVHAGI